MKANTVEPQDVVLGRVIEFEMLTFICGLSGFVSIRNDRKLSRYRFESNQKPHKTQTDTQRSPRKFYSWIVKMFYLFGNVLRRRVKLMSQTFSQLQDSSLSSTCKQV